VLDDLFVDLCSKLLVADIVSVLRRDHNCFEPERPAIAIFNCHLRFSIRTQIGKLT
jgi:hypothetical protein